MLPILIIASLASSSFAQASNPLIPDVSAQCTQFLNLLNNDTTLPQCLQPIIDATSQFGPGGSGNPTVASVTQALGTLCAPPSSGSCSDSTIMGKLADFYNACQVELTSDNGPTVGIYESLYAIIPFKQAVCSKDTSGNYCDLAVNSDVTNSTGNSKAVSSANQVSLGDLYYPAPSSLTRRADSNQTAALVPNSTTFRNLNLLFLFITPDMPSNTLCTSCTRSVLMSYINFEESVPFAPGLSNSKLFGGQSDLYTAVQTKCGAAFMGGAVQAAGGISGGLINGAASIHSSQLGSIASVLSVLALGLAAVF